MTLLGQHEAVDAPAVWGMYSPSYAHSAIQVAQGKEHLRSATSALMSLESEPNHTPEQYTHPRPTERVQPPRSSSESQDRDDWTRAQATQSLLRLDSASQSGMPFNNSGSYLQGAHRWAATASPPSTPSSGPAADTQQSYLSAPPTSQHTGAQYSNLVTHAPQPVHAQSVASGSQFLAMHSTPFPSSLSPPNIIRQSDSVSSSSLQNLRRRSSPATPGSASSSNTVTGSSLALNFGSRHPDASLSKLARSRNTFNLTNSTAPGSAPREKPKLLSKDQKKKNHIHSEQKRRATIRKGYALLCDQVPSLRMAIAAAEADEAEQAADGDSRRRRRSRGRASTTDGERLDGRAGPRSESVVLVKTIDHLKDLLASRQELLTRVQEMRATGLGGDSPWERAWDGGTGLAPEDDGDEEDDGDDGEGESDEADDR
ncbi:helix loop helix DNA-binding domain protein [Ceratobasidium sp. AG-Ba]|nr:helix loop helix DNA-binding domain protein [Ceratobasidium sp. AG-Ba]QRW03918.1 helix loop helix DNA-binding domain protein [Ceratobasidium sp. AG-Ba]